MSKALTNIGHSAQRAVHANGGREMGYVPVMGARTATAAVTLFCQDMTETCGKRVSDNSGGRCSMWLRHSLFPGLAVLCAAGCTATHTAFCLHTWYEAASGSACIEIYDAGGISRMAIREGREDKWECDLRKQGSPTSYTWRLNLPDGSYRLKWLDNNGEKSEWPIRVHDGRVSPEWLGCL